MCKNNRFYEHKKTGIALGRGSGFSLPMLKRKMTCFVTASFSIYRYEAVRYNLRRNFSSISTVILSKS